MSNRSAIWFQCVNCDVNWGIDLDGAAWGNGELRCPMCEENEFIVYAEAYND